MIKNHEQAAEPLHNNAPSTLSLWKWDSISETSTQACDMEDAKIRRIIACSILMIISGMNKSARHSWIYILTFLIFFVILSLTTLFSCYDTFIEIAANLLNIGSLVMAYQFW